MNAGGTREGWSASGLAGIVENMSFGRTHEEVVIYTRRQKKHDHSKDKRGKK